MGGFDPLLVVSGEVPVCEHACPVGRSEERSEEGSTWESNGGDI
jgi:hypothetical protein